MEVGDGSETFSKWLNRTVTNEALEPAASYCINFVYMFNVGETVHERIYNEMNVTLPTKIDEARPPPRRTGTTVVAHFVALVCLLLGTFLVYRYAVYYVTLLVYVSYEAQTIRKLPREIQTQIAIADTDRSCHAPRSESATKRTSTNSCLSTIANFRTSCTTRRTTNLNTAND